ncbi:glutathione S-transferase N-terminal domain-containing protein [Paraferrimonas sp. SM1919]|uniref:glutaredoxin family protein n=1 Tax=Paraferrimonas sp. SM1919 TaxID=2662263 RepID=UPI0013D0D7E3|nr:glutathione S-transferase N-terminal domain-containing protein [Paraferrimonas sp. SM1919]
MKLIRWFLGKVILVGDFLTRPSLPKRTEQQQAELDAKTAQYQLYQYAACPFCVKVRRQIRRLGLNIELVDAKQDQHRSDLIANAGKAMVPCLRINKADGSSEWMLESSDINAYLEKNYA